MRLLHQPQSPGDLILVAMRDGVDEAANAVHEKIVELSETTAINAAPATAYTPVASAKPFLWEEWDV